MYKPGQTQPDLPKNAGEESIAKIEALRTGKGTIETAQIRKAMQKNMQRNAAVYRIEKTLQEGCDKVDEVYQMYHDVKINDKGLVWNTDLIETLELENLLSIFYTIFSPSKPDPALGHQQERVARSPRPRRLPRARRRKLHDAHKLNNPRPEVREGKVGVPTREDVHARRERIPNSSSSKKSLLIVLKIK